MAQAVKSTKTVGSRANRRSRRLPAAHRMLLTIVNTTGSEITKEIVSTVEISQYGARVRGRRIFRADAEGLLTQLNSGRQARIRIAWQRPADAPAGLLDSGVEFLNSFDYWGVSFAEPAAEAEAPSSEATAAASSTGPLTAQELIETLVAEAADRPKVLEAVWCGLVEQLEKRQALSRADLIAAIRTLAQNSRPRQSKPRENSPEHRPEHRKDKK